MHNLFGVGRGGNCIPKCLLVVRELSGCLNSAPRFRNYQHRTSELLELKLKSGLCSDGGGLKNVPRPADGSWFKMLTCSAVPRSLSFQQGVSGLLRGAGQGRGPEIDCQMTKPQLVSKVGDGAAAVSLGSSSCGWRGLSNSQASGRGRKDGEMVVEEGFKQKTPKKKRRSVKTNDGLGLSANAPSGAAEAAEVGLSRDTGGSIHLIIGPMFAGKSTALLQRVQEEASGGRRVALVKSDKDTRYGLSAIVTHDGLKMPCYAVPDLATFKSKVGEKFYKELEVIGIDEAQFFIDLYEFCQSAADFEGKTIIAAGLDGDFLRRKFGSTLDLIPVADSVVKLSSRCEICSRPAIFSFRKTLDTHTELVGGADVYMPVCRQHFVNGQIVVEAASTVIGAHQVAQMSKDQ